MYTQIIRNPHYGPEGKPYTVQAVGAYGEAHEVSFWTEAEAWDYRDELLDAGWPQVRIIGSPTTIAGS